MEISGVGIPGFNIKMVSYFFLSRRRTTILFMFLFILILFSVLHFYGFYDVSRALTGKGQAAENTLPLTNKHNERFEIPEEKTREELFHHEGGELRTEDAKPYKAELHHLGVLASRNSSGWFSLNCNRDAKLRQISIPATDGNLTLYVYNSAADDNTASARAMEGWYWEKDEIGKFLNVSSHLPLIDVGANLGLVALQAVKQGRQVVAVEPIPGNALRLCRSAVDFGGHDPPLMHVIQNAVSSEEGKVTLAMPIPGGRTLYQVTEKGRGVGATTVDSIWLDRLLDVLPFKEAALKIDVESHEGHVLAVAEKLFREVDIPLVWLEWEHVKVKREKYGAAYVYQFMKRHNMVPHNIMSDEQLSWYNFPNWPFTVLWRREGWSHR